MVAELIIKAAQNFPRRTILRPPLRFFRPMAFFRIRSRLSVEETKAVTGRNAPGVLSALSSSALPRKL